MDLLLLHFVFLVWLSVAAALRWADHPADRFLAALALGWANLVATSLALSPLGRLGEPSWLFGVSIGLAALTALAARRFPLTPATAPAPAGETTDLTFHAVALTTLAALGLASAWAAGHYAPIDSLSVTSTVPRALLHVGEGNLLPLPSADARRVVLPFNHGLIHTVALGYQPTLVTLNFVSLLSWVAAGLAVHRLSRQIGAGPSAALAAAWCALVATPVLAQAATASASLPTAAALVAAASFAVDSLRRHHPGSAALAGLLAGLAAGSSVGALLLVVLALPIAFATGLRPRLSWFKFAVPGLVFGLLPFTLTLALATGPHLRNPIAALLDASLGPSPLGFDSWLPLWWTPPVLHPPTEDDVGLGLAGLACLLAALGGVARWPSQPRPWAWLSLPAVAWLGVTLISSRWLHLGSADLVPAVVLAAPALALSLDALQPGRRGLALTLAALVAASSAWSAFLYLGHNARRPLSPLLQGGPALAQPPPLPAPLALRLNSAPRINFLSDAPNEPLLWLMTRHQSQRYTCAQHLDPDAYNLVSRPSSARHAAGQRLDRAGSYLLLDFPGKPTAGLEPLGTLGEGPDARDYYGISGTANDEPADEVNRYLLLLLSPATDARATPSALQFSVKGLNPRDAAELEVLAEDAAGQPTTLGLFRDETPALLTPPAAYQRLLFRLLRAPGGHELNVASLPYAHTPLPPPAAPADPRQLFHVDLITSPESGPLACAGLDAPEGPYPQWRLPRLRWSRETGVVLRVTAPPDLVQLRLTLSARLHVRDRGILELLCNGTLVQRVEFNDPLAWQDLALDLPFQTGENVIELRSAPLPPDYDWADYLRRYADVKRYVEMNREPREQGARNHYDYAGKAEGRIMRLIDPPPPAPDSYFLMFRAFTVEGRRP